MQPPQILEVLELLLHPQRASTSALRPRSPLQTLAMQFGCTCTHACKALRAELLRSYTAICCVVDLQRRPQWQTQMLHSYTAITPCTGYRHRSLVIGARLRDTVPRTSQLPEQGTWFGEVSSPPHM